MPERRDPRRPARQWHSFKTGDVVTYENARVHWHPRSHVLATVTPVGMRALCGAMIGLHEVSDAPAPMCERCLKLRRRRRLRGWGEG